MPKAELQLPDFDNIASFGKGMPPVSGSMAQEPDSLTVGVTSATEDGWQKCLVCGKRGIKGTYYGRDKQYCSQACQRTSVRTTQTVDNGRPPLKSIPSGAPIGRKPLPRIGTSSVTHHIYSRLVSSGTLAQVNTLVNAFEQLHFAPVYCFKHAPLKKLWKRVFETGRLTAVDFKHNTGDAYWHANLVAHFGWFLFH